MAGTALYLVEFDEQIVKFRAILTLRFTNLCENRRLPL